VRPTLITKRHSSPPPRTLLSDYPNRDSWISSVWDIRYPSSGYEVSADSIRGTLDCDWEPTLTGLQTVMLRAGVGGTLVSIAFLFARSSAGNVTAVLLGTAMASLWALSPYWDMYRQQRRSSPARADQAVLLAASLLVVALGVGAIFLHSSSIQVHGGSRGQRCCCWVIPFYQWLILGAAHGVRSILRRRSRARS
jgi:hypothetical protein